MIDIYTHVSDLNKRDEIRGIIDFIPVYDYHHSYYEKSHRNELGMVHLGPVTIHFLMGQLLDETCPWCGDIPECKHEENPDYIWNGVSHKNYKFQMICKNCGSRGPKKYLFVREDFIEEVKALIVQNYKERIPLDKKLEREIKSMTIQEFNEWAEKDGYPSPPNVCTKCDRRIYDYCNNCGEKN